MKRLSEQVHRLTAPGLDVQVLPWQIDSVVSLRASYPCPVDLAAGEGLTLDLLAALLDKGTRQRTKIVIDDQLERIGASVSFSAHASRIDVSARFLARDLDMVLGLIREQLSEPALEEHELSLIKGRIRSHLAMQKSDPAFMGRNCLSRVLYGRDHPAHEWSPEDVLARIDTADVGLLRDLHERASMWDGLRAAVVGDLSGEEALIISESLSLKPDGSGLGFTYAPTPLTCSPDPGHRHLEIPDRPNLNVLMAHPVGVDTLSDDYLPLWMGTFVLGGNFSSRLMSEIRDERGLTYGIRSYLSGMGESWSGAWVTSVTLSADKLQEGVQATRQVLERFVEEGVSEDELYERKSTMIGAYEVDLSTTAGVAGRLLLNMNRGWEPSRLDDHPAMIAAVQTEDVNRVIRQWLHPSQLTIITAGTQT